MNILLRLCAVILSVTGLFLFMSRSSPAAAEKPRFPLDKLNEKAKKAKDGTPTSLRAFTDEVFAATVPADVAPSLKERLFKCEDAFRKGTHGAIREDDFVRTVNDNVTLFAGPDFAKTSKGQVRKLRKLTKQRVADLAIPQADVAAETPEEEPSELMSPAEAAYFAMNLGMLKLVVPDYQVPPEEWEREVETREAKAKQEKEKKAKVGSYLIAHNQRPELAAIRHAIRRDAGNEFSELVRGAHTFLDMLGFQR